LLRGHAPDVPAQVQRAARTSSCVLILGERGTGKEYLARAIHDQSARHRGPFVVVDLGELSSESLESELFGGGDAASSPLVERIGRLEAANHGTVFLGHVGLLTPIAQARLLQVLEKGIITPWESSVDRPVDVRLIAAANSGLEPRVANHSFREDLYYRLSVQVIRLSPLRERREDILPFVTHWVTEFCRAGGLPPLSLDVELLRWLENYAWPGNLRQLHSCLERMVVSARGPMLTLVDLPDEFVAPSAPGVAVPSVRKETLSELERTMALRTLQQCGGNRTRAAEILGISVRTLQRRLKDWDYHDEFTRI
jgi:two-component system NtrC family response regulator/two-component system response regulator HydG